MISVYLCLRVE